MFTAQPWKDYAIVISIITAGYYLFVILKFYRFEIQAMLKNHKRAISKAATEQTDLDEPDPPWLSDHPTDDWVYANDEKEENDSSKDSPEREEMFGQLENLAARLKVDIGEAHKKQYRKADLILLLQMTIKEYPALLGPPFRFAIDNLIDTECEKYGSIHLGVDDKVKLWNQVV